MGKSSAPAAPDYSQIASSDEANSIRATQLGDAQLQFAQAQFAQTWPYAQQYMNQQISSSAAQTQQAQDAQAYYKANYQPIETQFAQQAANYGSEANANQRAGSAMADVAQSFDSNRAAALSNLESYGIDPSQTRYGALDLGTRISQAAATAAAGTQSRLNTQATGLALEGDAINTGRGYASTVAGDYGTATNAGMAGINAANSTTMTGVNSMGSPTSYYNVANNANAGAASAMNMGYQNALSGSQFEAQQSEAAWGGIGSLVGTAAAVAGAAMMM